MDIQILARRFYDYSKYNKGLSPATIRRYRQVINFYSNHAGITEIEQVDRENVRELFYHGRAERQWTTNTYICYHKSLIVFFRWCVHEGYMKTNPVDDIEVPKLEKRIPSKLNKQDAMRILEVVDNYPYDNKFLRYRNYAIFATFIMAGLRKKELLNLKCVDIELDNLSIFVRQGKGSKDRVVPICYRLADALKRYAEERRKLNITCPEFFASYTYDKGFTHSGLVRVLRKIIQASRIKFTIHKLRHTFATLMLEGGCDIYSLSRMMGHNDIKTTTIYLAANIEHLRDQIMKHPLN
ncbi:MAG: tyrosine-type recombinase/integrase [Candidatus Moranbacteria bacterium]|nr:tyrosine-type recombinase/integrase [Candidatus Moranbacteria bacterium]